MRRKKLRVNIKRKRLENLERQALLPSEAGLGSKTTKKLWGTMVTEPTALFKFSVQECRELSTSLLTYNSPMDSDAQKVKDRINIVEIVGQYVPLRRAGRNWAGRCPFHKERTPSFYVSPERGTYKCFGCGEGGDVFSFIEKMDGIDFPSALKMLAEKAGVKLEQRGFKPRPPEEKEKEERLREVCEAAVLFFESTLAQREDVRAYLKARGVKDETVAHWRLGYAPATWDALSKHLVGLGFAHPEIVDAGFAVRSEKRPGEIFDRFRGRIMFPIFDVSGISIAVSGRFFEKVPGQSGDAEPAKYVNSPETLIFKKSRTLYGLNVARAAIRKADCILLVEGQFDLIMAHQSGLPFAVALSGTALTPEHLTLLGRLSKRLVLALDADDAGIRAGLKSAHMAITAGFDVKVPTFPQGQDPADVAKENPELLKAAIRTSKTAVEFFLEVLQARARDKRAYQKLVEGSILPLIAVMGSSIEQEHFIALVASRLGVSPEAVRAEVAKRPAPVFEEASPELHQKSAESELTPLQKKAGMLLFYFGRDSAQAGKLRDVLGEREVGIIEEELGTRAEELRFRFEAELGEHTSPEVVAADMLGEIERQMAKERFKMKFL
jgi:DNA primase